MYAVESVESFCINFAAALDVKGNFETLPLLNLGNVPNDVEATFTVFRGHLDVIALAGTALHGPILDFKLGR